MEASEVENLALKLCHLVPTLRGEGHISSAWVPAEEGMKQKHCEHTQASKLEQQNTSRAKRMCAILNSIPLSETLR